MIRLFQRPLNEIDEADLNGMIGNHKFREAQSIDYKRSLTNLGQREPKKEFIKDITAMANSFGGVLMIGVSEENGIPNSLEGQDTSIIGINHNDMDKLKTSLQEIIISNTEPRLAGVSIHQVTLKNCNNVIIFEIPKSPLLPHRSTLDNQFYYRYDTLSRAMSMDELRALMVNAESFSEKLTSFRADRIEKINSGQTMVKLFDLPKTVIHLIPHSAFSIQQVFDWGEIDYAQRLGPMANNPLYLFTPHKKHEARMVDEDGYLAFDDKQYDEQVAYTRLFSSGLIEAVDTGYFYPRETGIGKREVTTLSDQYLPAIIETIKHHLALLKQLGISCPIWIVVSIIQIKGFRIPYFEGRSGIDVPYNLHPFMKDNLLLQPISIENYDINLCNQLRPQFDKIWQAAGYPIALLDDQCNWKRV